MVKKFCDHACAASYNNAGDYFPKRKKGAKTCKDCGIIFVPIKVEVRCLPCRELYQKRLESRPRGKCAKSVIAAHATYTLGRTNRPKVCARCGYSKHVECCHIKAINKFSKDTQVGEINQLQNLIYLCPNCHWELDNEYFRVLHIESLNVFHISE